MAAVGGFLFLFLCLFGCAVVVVVVAATQGVVDSDSLAVGKWKLQLSSSCCDAIFPPKRTSRRPFTTANFRQERHTLFRRRQECDLILLENGTFALSATPLYDRSDDDQDNRRLPIHGRWYAANNPYCATDRFYQSIRLESYPRRQEEHRIKTGAAAADSGDDDKNNKSKKHRRTREKDAFATTTTTSTTRVLQRHQFILYGRLIGQFQRQGRRRHRITHGKIVQENLFLSTPQKRWWQQQQQQPRNPILASFVARKLDKDDDE